MSFIKKIITKLKSGMLSEMAREAKWMFSYGKVYWRAVLFYIILGLIATGIGLAGSIASKYLIDIVIGYVASEQSIEAGTVLRDSPIVLLGAIMLGSSVVSVLINALTSRISAKIDIKIFNDIQADVYDKIINTDWESLSKYRSGDLINRLNSDTSNVSSSIISWVPNLITRIAQFLGALGVILYYDPSMALIALLSAPVTIVFSRVLMRKMRKYTKEMRAISSQVMSFHDDTFQNIQSIKSFDLISLFSGKMRDLQSKYKNFYLDYKKFSIFTSSFMSIVASIVSFICFAWGAYRLWSGVISYGTMTLFLQLATSLSGAFSALVAMVPSAIAATTSAGRIMEVTKLPRETVLDSREVENLRETANDGGLSLGLENVSFKYMDGTNVLEDVCIDVPSGEITALIGPSGEGKTTIIRMLLGLLSPCEGNVFVENGQGERCEISASTRRLFSYVPQGNTIFAGTIAENLRMVNENATDSEIIEALKTACAYEFVEKLPDGINNLIGERGVGLSEGQAQRVSIARAILCDAPVLLLDEATSALDVATERRVLAGIMSSKSKKTCLVTTHRPSVLNMCSRIYRVDSTKVSVLSEEDAAKISMEF